MSSILRLLPSLSSVEGTHNTAALDHGDCFSGALARRGGLSGSVGRKTSGEVPQVLAVQLHSPEALPL